MQLPGISSLPRMPGLAALSRVDAAPLITLSWLVRLRWAAVTGQLLTIGVVHFGLGLALPLAKLVGIVGLTAASNALLVRRLRAPEAPSTLLVAGVIVADTLLLTGLLALTGGPANPFVVLYLLHVTLAVVTLGTGWGFALVALSAACFAVLFAAGAPLQNASGLDVRSLHLGGSLLAFLVAAVFIAYFLGRISAELRRRDRQLADVQQQVARDEKLASLTTLAAGAAHELGTPLGTIAVVSREVERAAKRLGDSGVEEDAQLIRREVERCRGILVQMSAKAGESAGEVPGPVDVSSLVTNVRTALPAARLARLEIERDPALSQVIAPRQALTHVLVSLVRNAFDASPDAARVTLSIARAPGVVRFSVRDRGHGMAPDVLSRAGEPFFTTKPTGSGTGLGLFLARAFAERLGGRLELRSMPDAGTTATVELPDGEGVGGKA